MAGFAKNSFPPKAKGMVNLLFPEDLYNELKEHGRPVDILAELAEEYLEECAPAEELKGPTAEERLHNLFRDHVIDRRMKLGLSIRELAKLSGVNASTISRFETGKSWPKQETLWKLSEALGIPGIMLSELYNRIRRIKS